MKINKMSVTRKKRRIMFGLLTLLLVCILVPSIAILICSPGKVEPFTDENGKQVPGSISEKLFIKSEV